MFVRSGAASEASESSFDKRLERSKVFEGLPKPMEIRSLASRQSGLSGLSEDSLPKALPVKLSGSIASASPASSDSLPEGLGQPLRSASPAPSAQASSSREVLKAPLRAAKPLMVSPFAASTDALPWEAPAPALLKKTASIPNIKGIDELPQLFPGEREPSPFNASVPVFKTGPGGPEELERRMNAAAGAAAAPRKLPWSQSMQERGANGGGLSKGAEDLLKVIMKVRPEQLTAILTDMVDEDMHSGMVLPSYWSWHDSRSLFRLQI